MTREMMPLRDAIGCLADIHETERDRIKAWAEEVAPKIAAELDIPLDQLRVVLNDYLVRHLVVMSEITYQEATELNNDDTASCEMPAQRNGN